MCVPGWTGAISSSVAPWHLVLLVSWTHTPQRVRIKTQRCSAIVYSAQQAPSLLNPSGPLKTLTVPSLIYYDSVASQTKLGFL